MLKRLLSCCVLVMCFIFPSFADDECPAGYGYTTLVNATVGGCVDLGTLRWQRLSECTHCFYTTILDLKQGLTKATVYSKEYGRGTLRNVPIENKSISQWTSGGLSYLYISIMDDDYTTTEEFAQSMKGKYLYYQRATDSTWLPPRDDTVCNIDTYSYEPYGEYVLPEIRECTLCPLNTYKDFVGNTECMPCPNGTMSPVGAKSADECGRILHVGDYIAFMPVGKRTEHGLCTMLGGVKYCADLYERQ